MPAVFTRITVTLGLCCLSGAAPALALPEDQSRIVRYADLDLTSHAGEEALWGRISRAVDRVCGDADLRDLQGMQAMKACRATALANATPKMRLAIANARSGKALAANVMAITPAGL